MGPGSRTVFASFRSAAAFNATPEKPVEAASSGRGYKMTNTVAGAVVVLSFSVSWLLARSCLHRVIHLIAKPQDNRFHL